MEKHEFAMRITELREQKGVSARDMSLSIGQNPGYINNIESGKAFPSLMGIYYICEYFGITPCELFDFENKTPSQLSDIITDLKKLDEKQLQTVAQLIKYMIKD